MHSLLARPTGLPARMAACVASRPATPTMAETTKSASAWVAQARCELGGQLLGGHGDDLRPPANGLCEGFVEVAAGGESRHGKTLRELLDNGECGLADGAGRTENGKSFQRIDNLESLMDNLSVP